jgi:hypothetical protein
VAYLESEEQAVPSGVTLELGSHFEEAGTWITYRLVLRSGQRQAVLEDAGARATGRCGLCLEPRDEVAILIAGSGDLLEGRRKSFRFEPQEPNWSMEVSFAPAGWTVYCWVDAGNQSADHYTWDAMGIRFFTDTARIRAFLEALETERTVY